MPEIKLTPFAGMNVVADDAALQVGGKAPRLFVRDAINIDIDASGGATLRESSELVTGQQFKNLWQSPLHNDVFATLGNQLVKVNPETWEYDVIRDGIGADMVCYEVVNNAVFISTTHEIFIYTGGADAKPLIIDTPAKPMATITNGGTLAGGTYITAISWLRGDIESGLSSNSKINIQVESNSSNFDIGASAISVAFPLSLDPSVTGVRVYVTTRNGSALFHHGDYGINETSVKITDVEQLGASAKFEHLSPMPSGRIMRYWQGRLISVHKNMIRFSQPLAYHLHDERHDFVMMPQRITFLVPVDSGIWVGQVDHVVFLSGATPATMSFVKKTSQSPVPDTAIGLNAEQLSSDINQGGSKTALWLAENGYVLGTASGQVIELHAGKMTGISAKSGTTVVLDRRVQTRVI